MKQSNVMILAPHPDDEFLNCTSILSQSRQVTIVYATNGDFAGRAATEIRYRESLTAMGMLGLGAENMIFLGYGDCGGTETSSFLSALWRAGADEVLASKVSCQTYGPRNHPEYHYQRNQVHAPYTRRTFLNDLRNVLCQIRPHYIFLPSVLDFHWDHRCLNKLTQKALAGIDFSPVCFTFLTHYGHDRDWPNRNGSNFSMPRGFPLQRWFDRIAIPVSAEQKEKLLSQFHSQKTEDGYLDAFCKRQEIYWPEREEARYAR